MYDDVVVQDDDQMMGGDYLASAQVSGVRRINNIGGGLDNKKMYLERDWNLVRDNVEFTREIDAEDFKKMEVLRWL